MPRKRTERPLLYPYTSFRLNRLKQELRLHFRYKDELLQFPSNPIRAEAGADLIFHAGMWTFRGKKPLRIKTFKARFPRG